MPRRKLTLTSILRVQAHPTHMPRAAKGGTAIGAPSASGLASRAPPPVEQAQEVRPSNPHRAAHRPPAARGDAACPPPLRTNRTRRVPHPVLIGHAASFTPYETLNREQTGILAARTGTLSARTRAAPGQNSSARILATRWARAGARLVKRCGSQIGHKSLGRRHAPCPDCRPARPGRARCGTTPACFWPAGSRPTISAGETTASPLRAPQT
jgi:hypothetical protein